MGVVNTEEPEVSIEMTSKPKERQFQVVPVPGVFTRGRWKCWDYRDEPVAEEKILNYVEKTDKLISQTVPALNDAVSPPNFDFLPSMESSSYTTNELLLPSTETNSVTATQGAVQALSSVNENNSVVLGKESSTIVVTSIAPGSVPAVQGNSRSATVASPEPLITSSTIHIPVVSSTLTILSEGESTVAPSASVSPPNAQCSTIATINLGSSPSPQPGPSQAFVSLPSLTPGVSTASIVSCV